MDEGFLRRNLMFMCYKVNIKVLGIKDFGSKIHSNRDFTQTYTFD